VAALDRTVGVDSELVGPEQAAWREIRLKKIQALARNRQPRGRSEPGGELTRLGDADVPVPGGQMEVARSCFLNRLVWA